MCIGYCRKHSIRSVEVRLKYLIWELRIHLIGQLSNRHPAHSCRCVLVLHQPLYEFVGDPALPEWLCVIPILLQDSIAVVEHDEPGQRQFFDLHNTCQLTLRGGVFMTAVRHD